MIRKLPLALLLGLAGCAVVPGSHLGYGSNVVVDQSGQVAELPLQVYHITPDLVAKQAQELPAVSQSNPQLEKQLDAYEYLLGPGDILGVTVWDHPEFSASVASANLASPSVADQQGLPGSTGSAMTTAIGGVGVSLPEVSIAPRQAGMRVERDGSVFLPLVGKMMVAGKSIPVLREQFTRSLSRYIRNPQVDVTVQSFNSKRVYLTGDIGKSGVLPITTSPLTLFDAVTRIGLAPTPDLEQVVLIRNNQRLTFSLEKLFKLGDASQNVLLQSGDVLNFSRNDNRIVFVLGEVGGQGAPGRSGRVPIGASGISLGEAIANAGGLNQLTANATGVFVMRGALDQNGKQFVKVFQLDVSNATALVLADGFRLQQRDFVYVTAAPIVRFNRVMSQITPFASNVLLFSTLQNN